MQNIKYTAPGWFAHIEASIRFKALPIHFCIQTPRVVPTLHYLYEVSFEEFRSRLGSGEATLRDVDPEGRSVLHVSTSLYFCCTTRVSTSVACESC